MNELLLYRAEKKIISPFCEISFVLENGASMEDFLESLDYWGVKYRDMNKEYAGAMQAFDKKREDIERLRRQF